MRNIDSWRPTKFIKNKNGKLIASRDPREVSVGSRFIADIIAEWYETNLNIFAKGDLLDLGCGKAPLYEVYSPLVNNITLADWENSLHENPHLDKVCDITKKLPFEDNSFDIIIFSDVLEHIPNPSYVLSEIRRILKPKGVVLMNVPFLYWIHEAPHDFHRYTEFMLIKMAQDNDMYVEKIEAAGGGWAVLIDLSSKLLQGRPRIVEFIQNVGPRVLSKKIKTRLELPLLYTAILRKGDS